MSTGSTRSLLSKVRKQTEPVVEHAAAASDAPAPRLTNMSTGRTAASFTSSSLTPQTKTERIAVDEEALMLEQVAGAKRAKAFVRLTTNFGALNLELHVDKAPKTVRCFANAVLQFPDAMPCWSVQRYHLSPPDFRVYDPRRRSYGQRARRQVVLGQAV